MLCVHWWTNDSSSQLLKGTVCSHKADTPAAPIATGACSLEEPHPKFSPPMTTGYFVFMLPSSMNLCHQYRLSTALQMISLVPSSLVGSSLLGLACSSVQSSALWPPTVPLRVQLCWEPDQGVAPQLLVLFSLQSTPTSETIRSHTRCVRLEASLRLRVCADSPRT